MEIHILLAGEQIGPFSEAQVRQYLDEGLVSPSDLAMCEGMEDWQSVALILGRLPASAPTSEKPEPPFPMSGNTPQNLEMTSASQKAKRKLNKIVIQPILPLQATGSISARKKNRTGKTALTLEPLRPTTSLPPVTGFAPREKEKKPVKALLRTGQLSLAGFVEKSAAAPTAQEPVAPTAPSNKIEFPPPPPLPEVTAGIPVATGGRISREFIYVCSGLAIFVLLIVGVVSPFVWLVFMTHHAKSPAPVPVQVENVPPSPSPASTQKSPAGPETAADYNARGVALQKRNDLDGAIADYNQALTLDPKNVQAYYQRGQARQSQDDLAGATADYNAVLSLNPRQADAFSNRGYIKQSQGDLDGALADYAQALLINPKISIVYYNQGLIEVQQGYLDAAIADYSHALDLDPKLAKGYYNRGNAKNMEGNLDGAIADYTQALALDPAIALAYCNRGFARQTKGDPDGALADYAQALALDPKMAVAFYNRGLIKVQKGDLQGAIDDSTQAIELDPKNGHAYCNRGLARLGKGNLDGAMADLKKFCEISPRDPSADSARLYLWLIATEQNPKGAADLKLSTSLQNDWNSPPEDFSSKIAAFLLGHIHEKELIANAASPDPSREPGQYCKAWYFAGMKRLFAGDKTTAIIDFQKSLATGQKDFCEYIFAQAELQALGQSRETPPKPAAGP